MPSPPESSPPSRPLGLLLVAAWVGLLVGASEAGLVWAARALQARVTLDALRANRHVYWMVVASDLAVFAFIGLALAGLATLRPSLARRLAGVSLGVPAFAGLLMAVPGLHWPARWVLAAGLGVQAARLARSHPAALARAVRWTLPAMVASVAVLGPLEYLRVVRAEARALATLPAPAPNAPNVLLLVLDTVRADHLSLYGYARDTTPNLARLAAGAVRFDAAVAPAPWTLPSHASMFTGRWPHELSSAVDRALDGTYPTLAEFLGSRGYATAGFVANTYYCNAAYGLDRGFSRYEDFAHNAVVSPYEIARSGALAERLLDLAGFEDLRHAGDKRIRKTAARINADVLGWIDAHRSRPFFAFANYYDAHGPYQPPDGAPRRFGLSTLPEAEREELLRERYRISRRKPSDPKGDPARDAALIARATDLIRDTYDDCLAQLDRELGDLFAQLDRRGLLDETIILVTSDHGEHFGEHHLYGHGLSLYRPEVHVPLLVFAPGAPRGRSVAEPVSLRDLPATVADLIGQRASSPFPGRSLARHFGGKSPEPEAVLTEVEHQKKFAPSPTIPASRGPVRGLVEGRWAFIRNADGSEELYDVVTDPGQATNLLKQGPGGQDADRFRTALERISKGEVAPEPRTARRGIEGRVVK